MSSAAVASGLCRRCSKPLVKNHGDIECLACGTLEVPGLTDRKSTRLNSSHIQKSRMPSSA